MVAVGIPSRRGSACFETGVAGTDGLSGYGIEDVRILLGLRGWRYVGGKDGTIVWEVGMFWGRGG